MKIVLFKLQRKVLASILPLVLFVFHVQTAYSESYTLSVGESVTISQTPFGGGYIDNVGLAAMLDPHLGFSKNYDGSATITVKSYFDYSASVQLVFIERTQSYYSGRYHTRAETYFKNVSIKCNYVAPKPNVKPTQVYLPERVRVPLNERVYITPIYEPNGAQGTILEWTQNQGTAVFSHMETTEGTYHVTGRSPGIGSLSLKVDNDNSLKATTVIEVVDPNYLPPENVFLPSSIEISVGGHATLQPILVPENAATSYIWSSDNSNIASVSYGKVTGMEIGTTTIQVKTANDFQSECKVIVVASNGKNDEDEDGNENKGTVDGHDYVDLGLSVKWATCNVGASSPEDFGSYYAWGETSEKTVYNWNTYLYGTYMNEVNIGSDIKRTEYDVACKKWGSKWRMPTQKEFSELYTNCTIKKVTRNSVEGYEITGNNGNSIFIPAAGYKDNSGFQDGLCYWSSNVSSSDPGRAWYLMIKSNKYNEIAYSILATARMKGLPIRPVTEESGEERGTEPTSILVSPSSKTIKIGETFNMAYTLSPSNAETAVTWTSDDSSIATVSSSGVVTGKKAGSTYINATTSNGKTDYCEVIVEEDSPSPSASIEINATNFPDPNFQKVLLELEEGMDGYFTNEELEGICFLNLHENGITDLKGLEFFTSLICFSSYGNSFSTIDLSKNTELMEFDCYDNELLSEVDISNNSKLEFFNCQNCNLNSLDTSNNPELRIVWIANNQVTSLDFSKNPNLEELRCNCNKLTSLDVSNCTVLETLYCPENQITSLSIANNVALKKLYCHRNLIKDTNMDNLIRNLPINYSDTESEFYVIDDVDSEGNVCTPTQVSAIKAKGWTPYYYDTTQYEWMEYTGNESTGIKVALDDKTQNIPIFDLFGKRLNNPRKGIYIMGGKKVVVK